MCVFVVPLNSLPLVVIMYILNYLDRNNISTAKLAGLQKDLNLVGNQYQIAVSILFVGYLLMQGQIRPDPLLSLLSPIVTLCTHKERILCADPRVPFPRE